MNKKPLIINKSFLNCIFSLPTAPQILPLTFPKFSKFSNCTNSTNTHRVNIPGQGPQSFNILDEYYKNPNRWAYTFQNYVFITRCVSPSVFF